MTDLRGFIGISELTHHVSAAYLRELRTPVVVMASNQPIAALIPYDTFIAWQETIELATTVDARILKTEGSQAIGSATPDLSSGSSSQARVEEERPVEELMNRRGRHNWWDRCTLLRDELFADCACADACEDCVRRRIIIENWVVRMVYPRLTPRWRGEESTHDEPAEASLARVEGEREATKNEVIRDGSACGNATAPATASANEKD